MADEFTIKINRRDGAVEVTGTDKDWVSREVEKRSVVFDTPIIPADEAASTQGEQSGAENESAAKQKDSSGGSRKRARSRGARSKVDDELRSKLDKSTKAKLEAFAEERALDSKSKQDQAAIIATFLQDDLKYDSISADELYTVYSVMGWDSPAKPSAVLTNAQQRNKYFGGWNDNRVSLTNKGENYGRRGSKASAD